MARNEFIIELVRHFLEAVQDQGVLLREAYLFGSYARGTQGKWADIDVALVSDDFFVVIFEDFK